MMHCCISSIATELHHAGPQPNCDVTLDAVFVLVLKEAATWLCYVLSIDV